MATNSNSTEEDSTELATLGGGCFWCTEAVFSQLKGVKKVESGYSGGKIENPTYKQVTSGKTGHVEVVQVTFNPTIITYREILEIFFETHDPTTLNRQGNDVGTQYRSVIFYHNQKQKEVAEKLIAELEQAQVYGKPIVTQVEPFSSFYISEEYHRDYFLRNPQQAYSRYIIAPKLAKLRYKFLEKIIDQDKG
jgi:peptide-methionine (S)-S-oxide reductase